MPTRAAERPLAPSVAKAADRLATLRTRLHARHLRRTARRRSAVPVGATTELQALLIDPLEGRVGSTALMRLLASSPDIAFDRVYPYENRYLNYLTTLLRHMPEPFRYGPTWNMEVMLEGPADAIGPFPFVPLGVDPEDLRDRALGALWTAFADAAAQFSGHRAQYYAEKTWGTDVELLVRAGVGTRVIQLVRDPRDVVASIRAFDRKRGFAGFGRVEGEPEDAYLRRLTSTMRKRFDTMVERERTADCRTVRYEDLILGTDAVAAELGTWLGVSLDAGEVGRSASSMAHHMTSADAPSSIGRWRRDLGAGEAAMVARHLAPLIRRHGYPTE